MAWHHGYRQVGQTESDACRTGLSKKAFADERGGGNARFFGCRTRPQHGGRAAASTAHAGDDGVDTERFHLGWEVGKNLPLVRAVGGAKVLPAHEFD